MQRIEAESPINKLPVDLMEGKGKHRATTHAVAGDGAQGVAQFGKGGSRRGHGTTRNSNRSRFVPVVERSQRGLVAVAVVARLENEGQSADPDPSASGPP